GGRGSALRRGGALRAQCLGAPAGARPGKRGAAAAGGGGAGGGRAGRGRRPAGRRVLAGDAAAAGHRRRPPRRPGGAALRRAGQRARHGRGALGAQAGAHPGRRGPDRVRLQPPDERDAAGRRPARGGGGRPAGRRRAAVRAGRGVDPQPGRGAHPRPRGAGRAAAPGRGRGRGRRRRAGGARDDGRGGRRRRAPGRGARARPPPRGGLAGAGLPRTHRHRSRVRRRARRPGRAGGEVMADGDRVHPAGPGRDGGAVVAGMQCTRSARGEFARAAAMEWTRLASLRTTWWCLGIGAAAMAVFAVLMGISTADEIADDPASASEFSYTRLTSQGVFYLLQFVVLTLAALIATGEQANGGSAAALLVVPRRGRLLAARTAVTAGFAFATGTAVTALGIGVLRLVLGAGVPLEPEYVVR